MLEYRIDRRSGMATYLQIVQQTKQALRLGLLEPGDKLPTAREVVEARRGMGTFVRRTLGAAPAGSPLWEELADWARRAGEAGLARDDVAALFTAALDEHFKGDDA